MVKLLGGATEKQSSPRHILKTTQDGGGEGRGGPQAGLRFLGWGPVLVTPVWRAGLALTLAWASDPDLASACQLFLG